MRLVGIYTNQKALREAGWASIEYLQRKIDLNLIILLRETRAVGDYVGVAGGGIPSDSVLRKAPFKPLVKEDDALPEILRQAHSRNIKVWLCAATYAEMLD